MWPHVVIAAVVVFQAQALLASVSAHAMQTRGSSFVVTGVVPEMMQVAVRTVSPVIELSASEAQTVARLDLVSNFEGGSISVYTKKTDGRIPQAEDPVQLNFSDCPALAGKNISISSHPWTLGSQPLNDCKISARWKGRAAPSPGAYRRVVVIQMVAG